VKREASTHPSNHSNGFADGAIWIADAHRRDGNRFVVHADEKLTAFLELEAVILTEQGQKPLPCPSFVVSRYLS
jgi:hypothetical protein